MQKKALIICCFVFAAGAFGTFFRWLQNQIVFDVETGLVNRSALNVIVPLIIIGAAALFYKLAKDLLKKYDAPYEMYDTFRGSTVIYPVVAWVVAVIVIVGGIFTMLSTRFDVQRGSYMIIAVTALLSGITFPLICTAARSRYAPGLVSLFMTLPIIMFCVWLITSYKTYSSNPNTWIYAIETLALCAALIAFYYNAGYAYGKPSPLASMITSMFATFLCFMTLADSRYTGLQILFVGCMGMLMMETWMVVSNMKEKALVEEDDDEPEAVSDETPDVGEEEPSADDEVISAGEADTAYEPTREAPYSAKTDDVDEIISDWRDSE